MGDDKEAPVYRLAPDYSSSPVWDQTGEVDLEDLPVSPELLADLRSWLTTWEDLTGWPPVERPGDGKGPAWRKWRRHGQHLANWLQRELGDGARVEYRL